MNANIVTQIDLQKFAQYVDPNTRRVLKILRDHHVPARVVGGAVRDALIGRPPRDIDLVVSDDPTETLFLLELYDIPSDTTGIEHGTVKAVFGYGKDKAKIEITSLGYRIRLRDNRPRVSQEDNWRQDSSMRDLSINSMSMDMHGHVWDYQDGYQDLKDQRIRLLPFVRTNILDDPNYIMRYFKAMTIFSNPRLMPEDLKFVRAHAPLLEKAADDERLARNLMTIQKSGNGQKIIRLMCQMGIKKYLSILPC